MDFTLLRLRLVAHLRERVRSGEWTERALARRTGLSQPHLHNVLKGARLLSSETADRLLHQLRIDLADLMRQEPCCDAVAVRIMPATGAWIGPGHPVPDLERAGEQFPLWWPYGDRPAAPVLVRLAADPLMTALFGHGDTALLDRAEAIRHNPEPGAYYAVALGGEALVRQVRLNREWLALSPTAGCGPFAGRYVSSPDRNILELVKAKVVWIGRKLEPPCLAPRQIEETGPKY